MPKNILIFSDGTGQAGGFMPDEARSNVYKLFRATRVGPDTDIDPRLQVAFYDGGLGSRAEDKIKIGFLRWIYNKLGQATGLGITQNIIDCYASIIRVWAPGDRIFLFGFSRGAYTVRCVGGVLKRCGVPTHAKDGSSLRYDWKSARAVASEAVKKVYQHGSSMKGDPLKVERLELAKKFRAEYASQYTPGDALRSNAAPYFIGVWDTVATLGAGVSGMVFVGALYFSSIAAVAAIPSWVSSRIWPNSIFDIGYWYYFLLLGFGVPALAYLYACWRYGGPVSLKKYRMAFYDDSLDPNVVHARHALSIDENRRKFQRVKWDEDDRNALKNENAARKSFEQVWFAGVHSDIGGSYAENESRLSDIAFRWMVDAASALEHPILVDRSVLKLSPAGDGPQHDAREQFIDDRANWIIWLASVFVNRKKIGWIEGLRIVPCDAPLHPSVLERFALPKVLIHGEMKPYRPAALRNHNDVTHYYTANGASPPKPPSPASPTTSR